MDVFFFMVDMCTGGLAFDRWMHASSGRLLVEGLCATYIAESAPTRDENARYDVLQPVARFSFLERWCRTDRGTELFSARDWPEGPYYGWRKGEKLDAQGEGLCTRGEVLGVVRDSTDQGECTFLVSGLHDQWSGFLLLKPFSGEKKCFGNGSFTLASWGYCSALPLPSLRAVTAAGVNTRGQHGIVFDLFYGAIPLGRLQEVMAHGRGKPPSRSPRLTATTTSPTIDSRMRASPA